MTDRPEHDPRVIVALDFPRSEPTLELVERLEPSLCRLKVGKELFTRAGPMLVETLSARGFDVFLDLKFHDIPNTVARACAVAAELGVWMVNVHALGGRRMMEAARAALDAYTGDQRPLLTGVTVLTSMDENDLREVGLSGLPADNVQRLAALAADSGLDGVVCSPQEAELLRRVHGTDFKLVTPGVRPAGSETGDQRRVSTPRQALESGSNYLVIGRPVTEADDPVAVLKPYAPRSSI